MDKNLIEVSDRIERGERLSEENGIKLLESSDLLSLGRLADFVRRNKAGDEVYFIANKHLYYTNVCVWRCKFCAFSRNLNDSDSYTKTIEDLILEVKNSENGLSELRITGGINPKLSFEFFENLIFSLKSAFPYLHIEAFAPTEIDFIALSSGLSVEDVLIRLKKAGLGSLAAGGAEVFSPRIRREFCPKKTSGKRWLEITKTAHQMGVCSNASLLYGLTETVEERIDHLIEVRNLQDETGGFNSFIPLPFLPENTKLFSFSGSTGFDILKMIAVSRLMLDNFKHIKFLWIYGGLKLGQTALSFGANDLGGTVIEENKGVARSAGAKNFGFTTREELIRTIKRADRIPFERGVLYQARN
ncbi:MAG: CofH family radical SAM protein [Actinobacteria bacterium]|nr:CofH family radical SAM protein [Actinomycetota bacterium]